MADWEEDKHPRDHGKFSSSEGAGAEAKPSMRERMAPGGDLHAKAVESLKDPEFVARNADRISRAGDEARSNYPGREGSDDAHDAALNHITGEAARIHAEEEAHGGDAEIKAAGERAARWSKQEGGDGEDQHAAAMQEIAHEKEAAELTARIQENEDRTIAAGHVTTAARDIVDQHEQAQEALKQTAEDHAAKLESAHNDAIASLAALHGYEHDGGASGGDPLEFEHTHELSDAFNNTHSNLESDGLQPRELADPSERETGEHEREAPEEADHPDSKDYEYSNLHPDHADYEYEHQHPDTEGMEYDNPNPNTDAYEHENLHPDDPRYEYDHPHPDDPGLSDGLKPKDADDHARMLSEHLSERQDALKDHNEETKGALADHNEERTLALAEHLAERESALAAHNDERTGQLEAHNAFQAHMAGVKQQAESAQSALERLHAQQLDSHAALKQIHSESNKTYDRAQKALDNFDVEGSINHAAFAEHERDYTNEDGSPGTAASAGDKEGTDPEFVVDDKAREEYEDAHSAATSIHEAAWSQLNDDSGKHDFGESLNALKSEMKSTVAAIKELSKHTGRAPNIPKPPVKTEKARRRRRAFYTAPDGGAMATASAY